MRVRPLHLTGWLVTGLVIAGLAAWGTLALYYLAPGSDALRLMLAGCFAMVGLAALVSLFFQQARRWGLIGFMAALLPVLVLWLGAKPRNDRDWQPELAVLPYASFDGDRVTIHNIRNFDYRSENDFTPVYHDKTFDLNRLDRVDLLASYWMGPAIAHLFLSFGFGDDHLAISIEARKDKSQPYSTLAGFFRQYELIYVVADERDLIRLRTDFRADPPEEVYLYRLQATAANIRRVFLDYLRAINELREHPRFYNSLTTNCTTTILTHATVNPGHVPYSWKVLLSGYVPEYLYDLGRLDRSVPFDALQERAHINAAARAAGGSPEFSRLIRGEIR